ncbi:MAG: diguanylate cyclase, partial [Lachnospiraceae bacterium]|nr:diguanylate cyclase [Lachnospiraceae bacterium]
MNFYENIVVFDKYRLVQSFGENSFYSEYLGKNIETDEDVYVKMINPDKFTRYEIDKICFANECAQIKSFDIPDILKLYAVGSYSNTMCIVSEYVHGFRLMKDYLKDRNSFGIKESLEIIQRLAQALKYAHSKGIIHRGIRSTSIGVVLNDDKELTGIKLLDFGVSQIIDYTNTTSDQVDDNFVFMAPETTGLLDHKVDARSDLYSLGILLYRFLTGHYPFHADTIDSMVYQHVAVMPKSPSEYNPTVSSEVSELVLRLLAKDPDQRYQSADELITDIDRYFHDSPSDFMSADRNSILQNMENRSKVVSRKNELAQIRNLYTRALKSEGHFCIVRGSIGCGKSDLLSNLASELSDSSIPYFRARFSSHNSGTPYHAFRDILKYYIKEVYNKYDNKKRATEKTRLFDTLCGQTDLITRFCSEMSAILPASGKITELDEFRDSQRAADRLSAFFLQLYDQGKPFVLILDDIHNADAASLTLLREMIMSIHNYKVFLVCSLRDSFDTNNELLNLIVRDTEEDSVNTSTVRLEDYSPDRMTEYVSDLLMINKANCQTIASYLMDKTGGNSYFACNLLRSMLEDGVINLSDGEIEEDIEQFHKIDSDVNVFQIIEARISKLSPETVHMLEVASVIGSEFSQVLLCTLLDMSEKQISPYIYEAVDKQVIEYSSTQKILCFSHRDILTVVNGHLSEAEQQELHLKIAKAIEHFHPDIPMMAEKINLTVNTAQEDSIKSFEINDIVFELVYHYSKADSNIDIKRYIMSAAIKADSTSAHDDAIRYFEKALELYSYGKTAERGCWLKAKQAMVELNLITGHYDTAIEAANYLLPLLDITASVTKAKLLHRIALGFYRQSKFTDCEEHLIEALSVLGIRFPSSGKPIGFSQNTLALKTYLSVRFNRNITNLSSDKNEPEKKEEPAPQSSPDPEETEEKEDAASVLIVNIYETLCWTYAYSNVQRFIYTTLRLYEFTKNAFGPSKQLAVAASAVAIYYLLKGDVARVDQMQKASLTLRTTLKDKYGEARSLLFTGFALQTISDIEGSIKSLKQASDRFKEIGDLWEYNNSLIFLLYSLLMIGDYSSCIKTASECKTMSEKLGDRFSLAKVYAILTECYTQIGNYSIAENSAKECEKIVQEIDFPYATVCYDLSYGKLLYEIGKYEQASKVLTNAKELIDNHSLSLVYLASVYPYLVLSKVQEYKAKRNNMSLGSRQTTEYEIKVLCEAAENLCSNIPNSMITVKRAWGQFAITSNNHQMAMKEFQAGVALISDVHYMYECAMLESEYGTYLYSKHRINESRFQVFEAYMTFINISSLIRAKECERIIDEHYHESFKENSLMKSITSQRERMNVDRKANTLLRLGERLTSTLELDELQKKILQDAVEMVGAERGILFLYPESGNKVLYVASVYNLGNFDGNTYEWMIREVEKSRKPIIINDMQSDEYRKHYSVMVRYGIKAVMAMPMFVRGNLFGIIYLDSRLVRQIFTEEYIEAMGFIANQAGAPIENARLYHKAITDGLTGIYGRSYLDNLIVDKTNEANPQLAAIMIDVDHFKKFNDTYGHQFGDKVLKELAGVMKYVAGDLGVPCRYGGEEFVILMNSNDEELVLNTAERVRQTIEAKSLPYNEGTDVQLVSVTISLGVSIWDPKTMERLDLIEHADKALYFAKHNGRNQVKLWDESV